jgi:hypothetical protein
MQPTSGQQSSTEKSKLTRDLHSIARAIFIIWIDTAMLLAMPWGWFLVGLGILILAAQLARSQMKIKIEGFRVAWGMVFLIGGLWTVLNFASWPLAPIVFILLGVVLLGKAVSASGADLRSLVMSARSRSHCNRFPALGRLGRLLHSQQVVTPTRGQGPARIGHVE